jgi:hypothetical protein
MSPSINGRGFPLQLVVVRPEGFMCHDWILDVLSDLKAYAIKNDLPALAAKVEETLAVTKAEIAAQVDQPTGSVKQTATPSGRAH